MPPTEPPAAGERGEPCTGRLRAGGLRHGLRRRARLRRRALLRWWPAVVYPAAFLGSSLLVQAQPEARRAEALLWVSTNLDNLADHPLRSLVASAFVTDGDVAAWTALAVLGFAGLVTAAGPWRAVVVGVAAHLIGTATSEGALALRIARGLEATSQRTILDVGPSFVVVGVLVATALCGPGLWWRLAAAGGFALPAPSLFAGLPSWDVAALGHVTAVVVGLAAGTWLLVRGAAGSTGAAAPTASGPGV
jgi:Rhomboid-like protein